MNSSTSKQREELDLAQRLLRVAGYGNVQPTPSDRPDVLAVVAGRRVGIEVTQFHADERTAEGRVGSHARAEEAKLSRATPNKPYQMWITVDPLSGLVARISEKIKISHGYERTQFDELWLLIAAGLPKLGAVASTVALPFLLDLSKLSGATSLPLANSPFSMAYFHTHLPTSLFCWSRHTDWRQLAPCQY